MRFTRVDPAPLVAACLALALGGCGCRHHHDDVNPSRTNEVNEQNVGQNGVTRFSTPGSTGSVTFVPGPAVPPIGEGSVEMRTGADGDSGEELRFTVLDGHPLTDVTLLDYWTFIQSGSGQQAPYLILRVDWNGDGTQDDLIFFEPEYQHGFTTDVPDQGDLVVGMWQDWDARDGGWWSLQDPAFPAGAGVDDLAAYAAAHPGATVVPGTDGSGGLRLVVGYGAPTWNDFVGNADALRVGVNGVVTTYDFEPSAP
jgi:hypothetical protein